MNLSPNFLGIYSEIFTDEMTYEIYFKLINKVTGQEQTLMVITKLG